MLLKPDLEWAADLTRGKGWGLRALLWGRFLQWYCLLWSLCSWGHGTITVHSLMPHYTLHAPCSSFSLRLLSSLQTLVSMRLPYCCHCVTISQQFQEASGRWGLWEGRQDQVDIPIWQISFSETTRSNTPLNTPTNGDWDIPDFTEKWNPIAWPSRQNLTPFLHFQNWPH